MAITKISSGVIGLNAVTATIVAENVITTSEIATNGVGTLQIANDAVTSAKLDTNIDVAGTLDVTGVLTADNNVVIAGNLTVNGSTVTNSSTNTTIEDALIELGTGTSGTPANDAGIVIERGSAANAFMGYDESADKFIVATTTATGSSTGNLSLTAAPLVTGALTASGLAYPTSDGSANQVLSTDGSGALGFTTVATGGAIVEKYTATGNGSTTAFDTGINPQDEVNSWVHIDGVYQNKSEYSFSGTTITFTAAPESGALIEIIIGKQGGFSTADSILGVYSATTSNTASYNTGLSATNENNVNVYVDGVYQPKSSFSWSGTTLTLDAVPPTGLALEVVASKTLTAGAVVTSSIADDAVTAAKLASNAVVSASIANNTIVGADISATTNITANVFTGALTGNVTGNVAGNVTGNVTGTAATVTGAAQTNITSVGTLTALTVDDITINGSTISDAGDFTLDVAGDINLDADGGDVNLKDGGTAMGRLGLENGDLNIANIRQDYDIRFKGMDGNTTPFTALRLDMSEAGRGYFNAGISVAGSLNLGDNNAIILGAGDDLQIKHDGSNSFIDETGTGNLYVKSNSQLYLMSDDVRIMNAANSESMIRAVVNGAVTLYHDNSPKMSTSATGIKIGAGGHPVDTDADDIVVMNTSGASGITISAQNNSVSSLRFGDSDLARSGMLYYNHNDNYLRIDTSGASRMFIYSNGLTTIDASSGSSIGNLRVKGTSGHSYIGVSRAAASQGEVGYTWNNNVSNMWWNYVAANSSILNWYSTTGTKMTLNNSSGDLNVTAGNVVVSNGKGIDFSATSGTGTSELLDDYEEGTFTPVVDNGTYTYLYRRGHYVKIGNLVHIHIGFKLNGASPNGSVGTISGLPFTSMAYGGYQEPHERVAVAGFCATANLSSHLSFFKGNSDTKLYARTSASNNDTAVASNSLWQAGTFIKLQMSYTVS